ncbi:DUF6279 family lipoprotein [Variovorax sp. PAMC 28711]|uniref:DUF6279 family lipoprotein n=1 Tax=Variovorax sp. PAMC 28711 TaxID=1795631 RepID=UPI000AFFC165|nr:DUF6279 family lipoprotein [Variovorax sp. PAMC 28711]
MLTVGAALSALAACSAVKLAYNNLPDIGYWWLDGYVDFNGTQTPKVRDDLAALLAWHRQTELPQIALLLQKAQGMAPDNVTAAQDCAFTDDIRTRLLAVTNQAETAGAELAVSLDEAQLQQLERKYEKNNADYASDWLKLTPAKQQQKRYDQFLDRNEDFYGRLDADQRALLRKLTAQSMFDARRLDAERRKRQQEALALLRRFVAERTPATEARLALHAYIQRIAEPPAGPWRDYQNTLLQEGCLYVATLHNATTPAQRQKAVERLRAYEADVRDLMGARP